MSRRALNYDRKKPKRNDLDKAAYSSESSFQEVTHRRGGPLGLCVTTLDTGRS